MTPEPFGQVIVEAQANGIPVIVPRSGGATEWLEDQKSCLFFESGNSDSLSNKLSSLGNNPLLYESLSQGGIEVTKQFNPNKVLNQIRRIYFQIISKRQS